MFANRRSQSAASVVIHCAVAFNVAGRTEYRTSRPIRPPETSPTASNTAKVLDHRLSRDRESLGERCHGGLAPSDSSSANGQPSIVDLSPR